MSTQKNTITIHISESGTVKSKTQHTAIVSAIVVPFDHRKEVKQAIKEALEKGGVEPEKRIIKWTKVSPKEQNIYMNVLAALNRDDLVSFYAIKIRNFKTRKIMPAYVQLIQAIAKDYPDYEIRVFVQASEGTASNRMKRLEDAINDKMDININQAPLIESRFIQCADLIGGAILFFTRDDMYLEKMGQPGKASVVEYGLGLKKKPGKFNILDFREGR